MENNVTNNNKKDTVLMKVLSSLSVALIIGVFTFFQNVQIFKAKTEKDIAIIHTELEKKGNKEMQVDLKKRLERIENKVDKLIDKIK